MRRLLLVVGLLSTLVGPGYTFNLDSLLIQSVGGPTALEKLRSVSTMYVSGVTDLSGTPGKMSISVQIPDRLRVEMQLGPMTLIQAFDGATAWQRDLNGQISMLSGSEERTILGQIYFQTYSFLFDDRLAGGKEYLGIENRHGVECHKVAFYPLNLDTVYSYFAVTNGWQLYDVTLLDNLEVETEYSGHKPVEGVLVATKSHSVAAAAQYDIKMSIDSMTFNVPLDPSIFRPPVSEVDFRFPSGADSVLVPVQLVGGKIYLQAYVNGKPFRFLLDSGASSNLFNQAAFADFDLPTTGSLPVMGVAGYEKVNLVETDSLTINGLVLLSQVGGMMDLSEIPEGPDHGLPFGGLLGYDFLSRFPILIDFSAGSLTVYDPEGFKPVPGGHEVPFDLTMQVPTIDAKLNGRPGRFLVDLGNPMGLIVHNEFSRKYDLLSSLEKVADRHSGIAGVGGGIASKTAVASSFTFGDIRISELQVLLPDSGNALAGSVELAGNIGNELLRQFRVLFDYRSRLLIFYGADQSEK